MLPLARKVARVTRASRGIGKGIAQALGAAGAIVYLTGRSEPPATRRCRCRERFTRLSRW